MNKKLIGAVLGTLAFGGISGIARAEDAPADAKPAKAKKAKKEKSDKKGEGGEKSCGADGKSCSGKK